MLLPVSGWDDKLSMVIYCRNGIGKTTFAASSSLKTLIIDCNEKGWKVVRKNPNVTRYALTHFEQLDWIYWLLRSGKHEFDVVAIDTVTMLATLGMKWILKQDSDQDMNRDPMTPDKRQWGKLGEMMKDAIIKFRNLTSAENTSRPMHVIFLAQEKTTSNEDEDTGEMSVETHPELSPSPRSTLLSAVDLIGRLYVREVELKNGKKKMERRMLLGAHPKYVSKNRFDELQRIERNPTLQGFLEKIGALSAEA